MRCDMKDLVRYRAMELSAANGRCFAARELAAARRSRDVASQGRGRDGGSVDGARGGADCRRTRAHGFSGTRSRREPAAGRLTKCKPSSSMLASQGSPSRYLAAELSWSFRRGAAMKFAGIAFATILISSAPSPAHKAERQAAGVPHQAIPRRVPTPRAHRRPREVR